MMRIRTSGLLLACLLALGACASGQAVAPSKPELVYIPVPPGDPLLDNGVSQGAVLGDRLWVIGSLGSLVSLGLTDESRAVAFDRDVVFLTKSGGALWALRSTELRYHEDPPVRTPSGGIFVVSRSTGGAFGDSPPLKLSEMPVALAVTADGSAIVLTPTGLHVLRDWARHWVSRKLKGPPVSSAPPSPPAIAISGDDLYVGFNFGEFGGGLRKVSLATGITRDVAYRIEGSRCAAGCEPITGIIADPTAPGCILASVGLVHMMSSGRILEICGEQAKIRFEKTVTVDWDKKPIDMTVPFFGLTATQSGGFWAISPGTLYRFDGQAPREYPLSEPKKVHGLYINRDLPDAIVVYTLTNAAMSLSGPTPLLIPLN